MSCVAIKYSNLRSAANSADKVAAKYERYHDSLNSTVYRKLNNYNGPSSGNISNARSNVLTKLNSLSTTQRAYKNYATAIRSSLQECKDTDKRVKDTVNNLTAQFKSNHGIRNSWVENTISNAITWIKNKTFVGRWLSNAIDKYRIGRDYIKNRISAWYNFDGGKDFIKGITIAALEIVLGVCAVIVAIASGGWLVAVIAGVIAGVIAVANGVTNLINECRGISVSSVDPALAKKLHGENSMQDTLRKEATKDHFGVSKAYAIARGIDIVNFVCTAITLVDGCKRLVESGMKWANSTAHVSCKDFFNPSNYKSIFTKIKGTVKESWGNFKLSLHEGDLNIAKTLFNGIKSEGKVVLSDIGKHFSDMFTKKSGLKAVAEQIKDITSLAKTSIGLLSFDYDSLKGFQINFDTKQDGFGKDLRNFIIQDIVFSSVVVYKPDFMLEIDKEKKFTWNPFEENGQIKWDFDYRKWKIDKFYGKFDTVKSKIIDSNIFKTDTNMISDKLSADILSKISQPCSVEIGIPVIDMPIFRMNSNPNGCVTNCFNTTAPNSLFTDIPSVSSNIPAAHLPSFSFNDIKIPIMNFKFFVDAHATAMV